MRTIAIDERVFLECHIKDAMERLKRGEIKTATIKYQDELNISEKMFSLEEV